jgi:hypothetical protein
MDAFLHDRFLGGFLEVSDDRTLTNLTSGTHTILDTSIYGRTAKDATWQRLYLDDNDIMRVASIDQTKFKDLSSHFEKRLVGSDSNLFWGSQ